MTEQPTETIAARLDREVERLMEAKDEQISESFTRGVAHAAVLARLMPRLDSTVLTDLRSQLVNRAASVDAMADTAEFADGRQRLSGRADGLRLALSYLNEILRENGVQS